MKKKISTQTLVRLAILSSLIIVMTVVPYTGYIYYGIIEITTLHIVVAVGAAMLGWRCGGILGFVWGVTCMARALTNPLWAPFLNPLISLVPRVCVGIVAGLAAEKMQKLHCRVYVTGAVAGAAATLTNTVLVLSALKAFSSMLSGSQLAMVIYSTLIGVNGLIELAAAVVVTPVVLAALRPRELVLGIDVGASTTKLALLSNGKVISTLRAKDGEGLEEAAERILVAGVKRIAVTGVGSARIGETLLGLPVTRVDEFQAVSGGASKISGKRNCLVVSIGTGTSFTRLTPLRAWHVGGTGMGGATLKSMAKTFCNCDSMDEFRQLALSGKLSGVDLQLSDVTDAQVGNLMPTSTVASLGKLTGETDRADLAAGLCNLVFENIGVMAAFAVKRHWTRNIVLVGTIMEWENAHGSLCPVEQLHNVHFIIPVHAPYATAIGAALYLKG